MEKGATKFDKLCHRVFSANENGTDYLSRRTGVKCGYCGYELEAYYCESRLYMVECHHCKTKALVMARSPQQAAYMTFGHAVYPVDEMGELFPSVNSRLMNCLLTLGRSLTVISRMTWFAVCTFRVRGRKERRSQDDCQ